MSEARGRPFLRALLGLLIFAVLLVGVSQVLYHDRILPGVTVAGISLGGKGEADAAGEIKDRAGRLNHLSFNDNGQTYTFSAEELGLRIDAAATARTAVQAGRESGVALAPSAFGFGTYESPVVYRLNRDALRQKLLDRTAGTSEAARDAQVVPENGDFTTAPEADGFGVDVDQAVRDASMAVEHLRGEVTIKRTTLYPSIQRNTLAPTLAEARVLAEQPAQIAAGDREFIPEPATVRGWVGFRTVNDVKQSFLDHTTLVPAFLKLIFVQPAEVTDQPRRLVADYDQVAVGRYVRTVADQVDRPPVNGRLSMVGNKLKFSGAAKDGQVVDRTMAVDAVIKQTKRGEVAVLPIQTKTAEVSPENLDRLGIKTRIGLATTTFGGSPPNRTYNIGVGADRFDGVLIKPGQEFSFNERLGEVGPETGYLPELVILANKTTPQYGGGLCQVSTTMFRAALDTGLPITDRTNHSYAVHYYAPIGMDATIYPPSPDMKFVNNTPGYILVQTSQSGQSLTYEFYGTSDGRKSLTEIGHIAATEEGGGTASFRYVVTGGPDPIDRVFYSSYQPRKAFPVSGAQSLN